MITHGKKQISEIVYARKASEGGGAVRLTNIIRGAQAVFGGLEPNTFGWLTKAAGKAILAAFGQTDGKAVIKATNAYLNGIAASDPTKASALAGFINEDPMLVCSLGLQPQGVNMPISVLVCAKGAAIETGIVSTTKTILKTDIMFTGTSGGVHLGRVDHTDNDDWRAMDLNGTLYFDCGGARMTRSFPLNSRKKLELGNNYTIVDGVKNTGSTQSNIYANRIAVAFDGPLNIYGSMEIFDGSIWHKFVPCKTGLLDLEIMSYNQGTDGNVSIAYTLPDGTTWTPRNQTP